MKHTPYGINLSRDLKLCVWCGGSSLHFLSGVEQRKCKRLTHD